MEKDILVFGADFCASCKGYKQRLKTLGIPFTEIDAEEEVDLANKYSIRTLPTTILLENDKVVAKFVGFLKDDDIKKYLAY